MLLNPTSCKLMEGLVLQSCSLNVKDIIQCKLVAGISLSIVNPVQTSLYNANMMSDANECIHWLVLLALHETGFNQLSSLKGLLN